MASDGTSSVFITHLYALPIINDGITYFKSHPIGQKSLAVSNSAYESFVKPFSPYIERANGYASPYITKADNLADSGLGHVEQRFPIVKEPTETIKDRVTETVGYPRKRASDAVAYGSERAQESKEYVLSIYSDQAKKTGADQQKGLVPFAKATIGTSIVITAQLVSWVASILQARRDRAVKEAQHKTEQAKEVVDEQTEQ